MHTSWKRRRGWVCSSAIQARSKKPGIKRVDGSTSATSGKVISGKGKGRLWSRSSDVGDPQRTGDVFANVMAFIRSSVQCDAMEAAGKHSRLLIKCPCEGPSLFHYQAFPLPQCPVDRDILPILLKSNTMLKAESINKAG